MSDLLSNFNLELSLFLREIDSFEKNVGKVNENTTKLLLEAVVSIDRLMTNARFQETSANDECDNDFVKNLSDEQFECRRVILCRSCVDQFPLDRVDFKTHIQKESHKSKSAESIHAHSDRPSNSIVSKVNLQSTSMTPKTTNDLKSTVSSSRIKQNVNGSNNHPQPTTSTPKSFARSLSDSTSNAPIATRQSIEKDGMPEEVKEIEARTNERVRHETEIIEQLKMRLQSFDAALKVVPFGSATYGFGSIDTDLNIAIFATQTTKQSPKDLIDSIQKHLVMNNIHYGFKDIVEVPANRVLDKQLKFVHNDSGIECLLVVDIDGSLIKSSQIIRDFIKVSPICQKMIATVRDWQNGLKNIKQNVFQFNTYILSVLVIFYLQMEKKLPTVDQLEKMVLDQKAIESANKTFPHDLNNLQSLLYGFFNLYGNRYQISHLLISTYIGHWQEQGIQPKQTQFTLNHKRLRDKRQENPANWSNCTMHIEDLVRKGVNIAAEISKSDAYNFQILCQQFAPQLKNKA